jgi:hypothetical protein
MSSNGVFGQNDDQDTSRKMYDSGGSHTRLTPQCAGCKGPHVILSLIGALFLRPDAASDLQLLTMAPPNDAAPQRHFVGSAIYRCK